MYDFASQSYRHLSLKHLEVGMIKQILLQVKVNYRGFVFAVVEQPVCLFVRWLPHLHRIAVSDSRDIILGWCV